MALKVLPLRSDIPHYEFRSELDEVQFVLSFRWNSRMDRWIMDIKDSSDTYLQMGIPLLIGTPLKFRFKEEELPEGDLFVLNLENEFQDGGENDLGTNVLLLYNEAS